MDRAGIFIVPTVRRGTARAEPREARTPLASDARRGRLFPPGFPARTRPTIGRHESRHGAPESARAGKPGHALRAQSSHRHVSPRVPARGGSTGRPGWAAPAGSPRAGAPTATRASAGSAPPRRGSLSPPCPALGLGGGKLPDGPRNVTRRRGARLCRRCPRARATCPLSARRSRRRTPGSPIAHHAAAGPRAGRHPGTATPRQAFNSF